MLCQICKKNPATVHIQEIVNGEKHAMHFCVSCAAKKSMLDPLFKEFDLPGILSDIVGANALDMVTPPEEKPTPEALTTVCPACGWDYEQLQKTGRLGCPECYPVFAPYFTRDLLSVQRGLHHVGKCPAVPVAADPLAASKRRVSLRLRRQAELAQLKKDLTASVRREEFELAAELRDRIAELEQKLAPTRKKS